MIVKLLLTITLAWGTLAFGAVYPWAHRPLLVLAVVTGALAWIGADRRITPVAILASAVATMAAVAAQLVPLDVSTIAWVSPGTHRVLNQIHFGYAAAVAGGVAHSHPLSVAPGLTAVGLMFLGSTTVLTLGTSQWLTRARLRYLAGAIVTLGGVISVIGMVQRMLSPTLVYGQPALIYGFWEPLYGRDPFGPFVNKNHFAGWILMAMPLAIGLAIGLGVRSSRKPARDWRAQLVRLSEADSSRATLSAFSALLMGMALLLTLSRSGITSAVVALLVGGFLSARGLSARAKVALAVGALAVSALAWVGVDVVVARFAALDAATYEARAAMWRDTWMMARDVPLTGVGLRAYTVASLVYQTALPDMHVGAAHNDWLQLIAEGGLLVCIPALCLLAALITTSRRRFREHRAASDFGTTYWIRCGAAVGVFAISVQSLVDFSLQMPGNTMMFAVLWAVAIARLPPLRVS